MSSHEIMMMRSYNLRVSLRTKFEIKDLGLPKYFLGAEVARSKDEIVISQRKFTLDLI